MAEHQLSRQGVVFFRFEQITQIGEPASGTWWLGNVRLDSHDVIGPRVAGVMASSDMSGNATIVFSEAIQGLTADSVHVRGPHGQAIGVVGEPVSSDSGRTFTLVFDQPWSLGGTYVVTIDGHVVDLAGNFLGQMVKGVPVDSISYTYEVVPLPERYPVYESFEDGEVFSLTAWDLQVAAGSIALETVLGSIGVSTHLALHVESNEPATATLVVDVSEVDRDNLFLQFATHASANGSLTLALRNDRRDWSPALIVPLSSQSELFHVDVREILDLGPAEVVELLEVSFRYEAVGELPMTFLLDDVSLSGNDADGPRLVHVVPGQQVVPTPYIELVFDEPLRSLDDMHLHLAEPIGHFSAVVASIEELDDGQRYRVFFAEPLVLAGVYRLQVRGVHDLAGNALNQDGDFRNGDVAEFEFVLQSEPRPLPIVEGFQSADIAELSSWQFDVESGTIEVDLVAAHLPYVDPSVRGLVFSNPKGGGLQHATIVVGTAEQTESQDLNLYWTAFGSQYLGQLEVTVSPDGSSWSIPRRSAIGNQRVDLNELLRAESISFGNQLYVRFTHVPIGGQQGTFAIDEVRIDAVDVDPPRLATAQPVWEKNSDLVTAADEEEIWLQGLRLEFDEPIRFEPLVSSPTLVFAPGMSRIDVRQSFVDPQDPRVFHITFDSPQIARGLYQYRLPLGISDVTGNNLEIRQGTCRISPSQLAFPVKPGEPIPWALFRNRGQVDVRTDATNHETLLHFDAGTTVGIQEAIVIVDLDGRQEGVDIELGYWVDSTTYPHVDVSTNGLVWLPLSPIDAVSGVATEYYANVDSAFEQYGAKLDRLLMVRIYGRYAPRVPREFTIGRFRVDDRQTTPPLVTSFEPINDVIPWEGFRVSFSEPVVAFSGEHITVASPHGQRLDVLVTPVEGSDDTLFEVHLDPPHHIAGTYSVAIGGGLVDRDGSQFDQDQVLPPTSFTGEQAVASRITEFPYFEDFEGPEPVDLSAWTYLTGTSIDAAAETPSNNYLTISSGPAVIAVDLHEQVDAQDLEVDFRAKSTAGDDLFVQLYAGYMGEWFRLGWFDAQEDWQHVHFILDPRQMAAGAGMDTVVYLQLRTREPLSIDDFRIGNADVEGPRVESVRTQSTIREGTTHLVVTFSEPIQSLAADDIILVTPTGAAIAGRTPVRRGDGRTYWIPLATVPREPGNYQLIVDRGVRDLAGNVLNEDQDVINGEDDSHHTFRLPQLLPATTTKDRAAMVDAALLIPERWSRFGFPNAMSVRIEPALAVGWVGWVRDPGL
ncbi:MAG: Ig-like domain-containing protein [Planctomycetales bacterium]|nr:Ig-like domain-containing protein [Planctomycetales bacterium]